MSGITASGESERAAARPLARRVGDALTMFLVTALSLVLLVYVGFGEGKRTYGDFHIDKVGAQAGIVRNSMESFLRHGLPVRQYVGFGTLTQPVVDSSDMAGLIAYDQSGREVFRNIDKSRPDVPPPPGIDRVGDEVTVNQTDDFYQVILPLRTRFETAGSLVATSFKNVVTDRVTKSFQPVLLFAIGLSAVFAVFATVAGPALVRGRWPWLQISYGVTFLAAATVVIMTLVSLYSEGVQGKARALADTLGQRVGEIVAFNLSLRDFEGLDRSFDEYRRINPDISAAALLENGVVRIHTDRDKVGKPWVADARNYEYVKPVGQSGDVALSIAIAVPRDLVLRQVTRSVKNFAALFVASAFLAGLFLQVAASLQNVGRGATDGEGHSLVGPRDMMSAGVVKPLFFIAIFLEHMTYSFLPQYMSNVAAASGLSTSFASAPFMAYYLFFALSLIPSGHVAQTFGPRALIHGGLILAGVGLLILVLPVGFWGVVGARVMSGIGQGMLFIGVQSYILANAASGKRTQGNGIIVFGFQGGMISGMAIGSLLVTYMGPDGIFKLSGLLACVTALYGLMVMPADAPQQQASASLGATMRRLAGDVSRVVSNGQFMQTMILIGIPAKAALTGVITFALPLLLAQQHYKQEDIGQIIMLYAIGVVVASHYVSRLVDRTGRTVHVLTAGAAVSGLGMIVVGQTEWGSLDSMYGQLLPTVIIALGVMIVGMAHGCVNAPVVTHIAELKLAQRIGVDATTATYRFLERVGHIAGPIVAGQMFLMLGVSPAVVTWFGAATIIMAIVFFALFDAGDQAQPRVEKAA
jgi:predicted MFS family arabinose efflux permease